MKLGESAEIIATEHGKLCVERVRNRWRIYEVIESGGFVLRGKAVRQDDKPTAFWTKEAAMAYIKTSFR